MKLNNHQINRWTDMTESSCVLAKSHSKSSSSHPPPSRLLPHANIGFFQMLFQSVSGTSLQLTCVSCALIPTLYGCEKFWVIVAKKWHLCSNCARLEPLVVAIMHLKASSWKMCFSGVSGLVKRAIKICKFCLSRWKWFIKAGLIQ